MGARKRPTVARRKPGSAPAAAPILIRDRIKAFRRVPSDKFRPSDKNFRVHSDAQREAWRAMMREIGFAGAVLARECGDGTYEDDGSGTGTYDLVDGHMRVDEGMGQALPTLVLDISETEADTLRALFDPLGDLAGVDSQHVQEVLDGVNVSSDALQVILLELTGHGRENLDEPKEGGGTVDDAAGGPQAMLLRPYEHYDYVMVVARSTMDWQALAAALALETVDSSAVPGVRKIGIGRVIDAAQLLGIIRAQAK